MVELDVKVVEQRWTRLGRQKVHDPRSRGFALPTTMEHADWKSKKIRIYDPSPNPNQCHGECTCVAKCVQMNAVGNRVAGKILNMDDAHDLYRIATSVDPFPGAWEPNDTGSSGLASAQAAKRLGIGGSYYHVFNGADGVVEQIQLGHVVSVGTWWTYDMFKPNEDGIIKPTGQQVGGHQYAARGYDKKRDLVLIRCWWGPDFRDVWIARGDLNDLILDDGDAHIQNRA